MPTLSYTATGFPDGSPSGLSGTHELTFSWSELVWAAITVGRAGISQVLQFGLFSAYEIVYRAAIVYANIMETAGGGLFRSAAYDGLDPSEKGAVSYFLGLLLFRNCLPSVACRCSGFCIWMFTVRSCRLFLGQAFKTGPRRPGL